MAGIEWERGVVVTGKRMDIPTLLIKVRVVADDVTETVVKNVLGERGVVSSCVRGTAPMAQGYAPTHERWVWDGVWHVALRPHANTTVPSYSLCDGDHWQL